IEPLLEAAHARPANHDRPGLQREPSRLPVAVAMPDWRVDPVAPLVPPPPERLCHLLLQHRLHELLDLHPHLRLQRLPRRPGALPLLSATPPMGDSPSTRTLPGLASQPEGYVARSLLHTR